MSEAAVDSMAGFVGDRSAGATLVSTSFLDFYNRAKGRPPINRLPSLILGIDPGETTGICEFTTFTDHSFARQSQRNTSIIEWGVDAYKEIIPSFLNVVVVIESYRIYSWRTKQHTWNELLTPRLIGVAECLCRLKNVPLIKQSAQVGKGFVTDERLKEWGFYKAGQPHAMDATRHVLQFLLFHEFKQ